MYFWSITSMWNITLRELKDRKWSLLAYCLGSLALLWIYVATFESSKNSSAQLQQLVKSYPKGILDAFGLSDININTVEIYLNAKHFSLLWPLIAIILAISRSAGQIAGEIQTGTMGLLLSLPIDRVKIIVAKYIASIITIATFTAVSVFGVMPLAAAYHIPTHPNILFSAWVLTSLFMWSIYSIGLAVSSVFSDKTPAYAVTSSIMIVSYVAYIVSLINDHLNSFKYYSLFHYFNTQAVLSTGSIPRSSFAVFGITIVLTSSFAAWQFNRRDISV